MVGGIIAWVKMKGTVDESERRIQDLEISQGELDKRQTTLESVLSGIKADVGWIRETLQRIQNRADRESNQD